MGQKNRKGAACTSAEAARAARWEGETPAAKGQPRGRPRGPCGRGCADARPGPLPPASTPASPRSLQASRTWEKHEGSLPRRSHSRRRRRLRARHYRQLKRHMQLLFSGPGHPRVRLPAALPRDNQPGSRDSGRRGVAVARSLKGGEGLGSMRGSFRVGAEPSSGAEPKQTRGGAKQPGG